MHSTLLSRLSFLIFLLAALTGCGRFWEDPYVTVTPTPLNWLEIHYYNAAKQPYRRTSVRINGMGRVEVKTGTSRLVSDSFAKDFTDATWADVRVHEYNIDPEHVREVFQDAVNGGLFNKDKMFTQTKTPLKGRFLAARAAIDNKTYSEPENLFESDPELAELLYNIVLEFRRPTLGKKK